MKFSDEMINAYADGELQGSEKTEFENTLKADTELKQALENVKELKFQLREAYHSVDVPPQAQRSSLNYRAASYAGLLLVAFASGWLGGDMMHRPGELMLQSHLISDNVHLVANTSGISDASGKYILHIGMHDNDKFRRTLDEAETLLANYGNSDQSIELEIIANAGGLNLFRDDGSPYAQRVKQLSKEYPNIKFIACTNAIERLRERGIEPNLINAVHQGPTALDQVVLRMNEGWTYIKI